MAGARHYTELVAWQLADQIRIETFRLTRRDPFARRSLNELLDGLRSAELKGYVLTAELQPVRDLARREFPAIGSLMAYLRRTGRRRARAQSLSEILCVGHTMRNRYAPQTEAREVAW